MATTYPNAKFTGIDISPIQPSQIKPENFTFFQANLLDGLPFADDSFDFVFQRFLIASITKDKWPVVINELTRILKPGGYLEVKYIGVYVFFKSAIYVLPIRSVFNQLVEVNISHQNIGPTSTRIVNACMKPFFFITAFIFFYLSSFLCFILLYL